MRPTGRPSFRTNFLPSFHINPASAMLAKKLVPPNKIGCLGGAGFPARSRCTQAPSRMGWNARATVVFPVFIRFYFLNLEGGLGHWPWHRPWSCHRCSGRFHAKISAWAQSFAKTSKFRVSGRWFRSLGRPGNPSPRATRAEASGAATDEAGPRVAGRHSLLHRMPHAAASRSCSERRSFSLDRLEAAAVA